MKNENKTLSVLISAALAIGPGWPAAAQGMKPLQTVPTDTVPNALNYQGRLEKSGFPVTGVRTMIFKLFDTATGGSALWTSGNVSVTIESGIFAVSLDIPVGYLSGASQKYLEIIVDGNTLSPRDPIGSVPYAKIAETVEGSIDISTQGFNLTTLLGTAMHISSFTGRVGISSSNPMGTLSVKTQTGDNYGLYVTSQNHNALFYVDRAGNVAVNTDAPGAKLDLRGDAKIGNAGTQATITTAGALEPATPVTTVFGGSGANLGTAARSSFLYLNGSTPRVAVATAGATGAVLESRGTAADPAWVSGTNASTANTYVKRDAARNFSANVITADLTGNAQTATTATNIAAGAAGSLPFQNAASATSMLAIGTGGRVLMSNGTNAPFWADPAISSAAHITGGAGGQVLFQSAANTTGKTAAGTAGQVLLSAGAGTPTWASQNTLVVGSISDPTADCAANQFANAINQSADLTCAAITDADVPNTITINKATNLTGGTAGRIPYQSAVDTTLFSAVGTLGDYLVSGGAGSPTWQAGSGLNIGTANDLAGGAAGTLPYQQAPNDTAMLAAGTANQVLLSGGAGAPSWANQNTLVVSRAAELSSSGGAGELPYQAGSNNTSMLAAGVSGQVLRSNGAAAPSWLNQSSLAAGTAAALAAVPSGCGAGQYATSIAADGDLGCAAPPASDIDPGTYPSGTYTYPGTVLIGGLTVRGAATNATICSAACSSGACIFYSTDDNDLFTSTGTAAGQWRNTRTGNGVCPP